MTGSKNSPKFHRASTRSRARRRTGLQKRAPQAAAYVFILVYAMVVASGLDAFIVTRRLKKQVAQRFGPEAYVRGTSMYAVFRAFQLRRSRIPRPGVKRGEQPR